MRLKRTIGTIAGGVLLAAGVMTMADGAGATGFGEGEGCTPGYWKNHTQSWEEYAPGQRVSSVFTSYAGTETLLQALQGGGGSGLDGARKILLRAAVAAVLNAAHDSLEYPWQRWSNGLRGAPLIASVNNALASNNRDTMLALATRLDNDNNASANGGCDFDPITNGTNGSEPT